MNSHGFNLAHAQRCLTACARSYREATFSDPDTDTQVLIIEQDDALIIAFRGSSSVTDWLTDLDAHFVAGPAGEVHHGFNEAAQAIINKVIFAARGAGARPIFLTGHSLGGALAMLVAYQLYLRELPVFEVITFGQPRVGDKSFRAFYDHALGDRTFRVVNPGDPVPLVPFWHWGYRHAGQEYFLSSPPKLNRRHTFRDILATFKIWRCRLSQLDGLLPDHALSEYERRLA